MSTIEDLKKIHDAREKLKLEPYKVIHKQIWQEIENSIKLNEKNYIEFEIPAIVLGYTQYNFDECCAWQIKKLEKKGKNYLTINLHGNKLIVSWNFNK